MISTLFYHNTDILFSMRSFSQSLLILINFLSKENYAAWKIVWLKFLQYHSSCRWVENYIYMYIVYVCARARVSMFEREVTSCYLNIHTSSFEDDRTTHGYIWPSQSLQSLPLVQPVASLAKDGFQTYHDENWIECDIRYSCFYFTDMIISHESLTS